MKARAYLFAASTLGWAFTAPAWAQNAPSATEAEATDQDIVVTAQRQSQRLQDVPIAISAFSAEKLAAQQINNTSDLQLTLPNVVFSQGNFNNASFTIRGIGDLCVGISCDSATAIHQNDAPLFNTRLFETEFFDLERIEVLRGPQGTLFGRNATSGVVNIITAKPDLTGFSASVDGEYGNYESKKIKGMINIPLGSTMAVRLAGVYLNRDGYTRNLFDNSRIDGRNLYALRGSFRWEPSASTTVDLVGYYFHEKDDRLRIQKQLCQRDPTGVIGCLPGRLDYGAANANSTLTSTLTSREFLATQGIPTSLALGSVYGPDIFATFTNPSDLRTVNTDYTPTYYSQEYVIQGKISQELGGGLSASLSGKYQNIEYSATQDYNLSITDRSLYTAGLTTLQAFANGAAGPGLTPYFAPLAKALIPNGPNGPICASIPDASGTGIFGGHSFCSATPQDFDRAAQKNSSWTAEGILRSDWDGRFNFLLGGTYSELKVTQSVYNVSSPGLDYINGVLGSFTSAGAALPPSYLATPYYENITPSYQLKSYGIFGEAYIKASDSVKLTLGLRWNHDSKSLAARQTILSFLTPYTSTDAFASPFIGSYDADQQTAGNQLFQVRSKSFGRLTGRAVLDWQITRQNLLYASYARGYKSGGFNPPVNASDVPEAFTPETVDSFEIGSKNTFGALQLNLTAFYYKYKGLQLSRIVQRTAVNDNVDANIYGLEAEAIVTPIRDVAVNMNFSYLKTEVSNDKFQSNPQDYSGGRSDAVIIKDLAGGAQCAVVPTTVGNAAGSNGFVSAVNGAINAGAIPGLAAGAGLQGPTAFPSDSGISATGAFSFCGVLAATASTIGASFGGVSVLDAGVPVNLRGKELPQAPNVKFSVGAQYTAHLGDDMTMIPRVDLTYTGESYGSIFNGKANRVQGYSQVNAQLTLNGRDERWYLRAFVQNVFDTNAITGLYVTDATSGVFTNVFTLEPRRYGIGAGFRF